ncbi:MAG: hypothetical protein EPN88_00100 [Bacteroidetes bacterium]|nr:MAG: hypothetical protein EPN88_00100 [Bacteroidota bacterium]
MLVILSDPTQAGIYSGAVRFTAAYPLFAGSFSTVLAPRIASITQLAELRHFLIKVILATGGLIGTIIVFIMIANPLMYVILGPKAEPIIPVLQILLVSMIFFVGSIPAVTLAVYYLKKPDILTLNSIIQVVIVIIGNYFFIPHFGRFGPAYSLILAYGTTFILTSIMSYWYLTRRYD